MQKNGVSKLFVPKIFYGFSHDVKKACTKLARIIVKEQPSDPLEVFSQGGTLDAKSTNGLLILDGPSPLLGKSSGEHFHLFEGPRQLFECCRKSNDHDFTRKMFQGVFRNAHSEPWRVLFLMPRTQWQMFLYSGEKENLAQVVQSTSKYWELLNSVGSKYSAGGTDPNDLWTVSNTLTFCLANLGFTNEQLDQPLPEGSLSRFVASGPNS